MTKEVPNINSKFHKISHFSPSVSENSMVERFMNHHDFAFDDTFGESVSNGEVYDGTARQIVLDALEGKQGTVMMCLGHQGVQLIWVFGAGIGW